MSELPDWAADTRSRTAYSRAHGHSGASHPVQFRLLFINLFYYFTPFGEIQYAMSPDDCHLHTTNGNYEKKCFADLQISEDGTTTAVQHLLRHYH